MPKKSVRPAYGDATPELLATVPRAFVVALLAIIVLGVSACGDKNKNPLAPTPVTAPTPAPAPVIPNVAGTYRGPLEFSGVVEGSTVSVSGAMSMIAAQAGTQLTISGSIELFGETDDLEPISGTIDAAGRVTLPVNSYQEEDPECGTVMTTVTLTFTGNMAVFYATVTSTCGPAEMSATLTRQ